MRRVSVVGNSGSGKSSLARRIAGVIDAPSIELDALYHQAGWQTTDADAFRREVEAVTAGERWVIDGNYRAVVVNGPVWERADAVVWLDLPRSQVMRQVTGRTMHRLIRREELWNGNCEPLVNLAFWRQDSILHWAWTHHATYEDRYRTAMTSPAFDHLEFVRLTSHADAGEWLAKLAG